MDFLSVPVPSLKEICKRFVIKKGISRIDLPTTLAEEVEEMEGRMKSIFTGTFHRHTDFSVTNTLTIAWTQGQWELTIKKAHGLVVAQETLVINYWASLVVNSSCCQEEQSPYSTSDSILEQKR